MFKGEGFIDLPLDESVLTLEELEEDHVEGSPDGPGDLDKSDSISDAFIMHGSEFPYD